jgi:hypothetical protein
VLYKLSYFALMVEAVSTSEKSLKFFETTWCNVPKYEHLHTCCRENLKSHLTPSFLNLTLHQNTAQSLYQGSPPPLVYLNCWRYKHLKFKINHGNAGFMTSISAVDVSSFCKVCTSQCPHWYPSSEILQWWVTKLDPSPRAVRRIDTVGTTRRSMA